MRLIDADELIASVGSYNPVKYTYEYGEVVSLEDINNAPSAINCAECVFYCDKYFKHYGFGNCLNGFGHNGMVYPNDYCSRAKRIDEVIE